MHVAKPGGAAQVYPKPTWSNCQADVGVPRIRDTVLEGPYNYKGYGIRDSYRIPSFMGITVSAVRLTDSLGCTLNPKQVSKNACCELEACLARPHERRGEQSV